MTGPMRYLSPGRGGGVRDYPGQLPVAGRRILPGRGLGELPEGHRGTGNRRHPQQVRVEVAQTCGLEVGQLQTTDPPGGMSERVRSGVSIVAGVWCRTCSAGVERTQYGAVRA